MQKSKAAGRVEGATIIGIGLMLAAIANFTGLNGAVKWLTQTHDPLQVAWARNVGALGVHVGRVFPSTRHEAPPPADAVRPNCARDLSAGLDDPLFHGLVPFGSSNRGRNPIHRPANGDRAICAFAGGTGGMAALAGRSHRVCRRLDHHSARALICSGPRFSSSPVRFAPRSIKSPRATLSSYDSPATAATIAAIVGVVALTPVAPFVWTDPDGWLSIALFIGLGVFAGFGHFLLTSSYRYAQASTLAPFAYTHLLGATIMGFLLFGNFPDKWTWVGAAVIISAGLYVAHRERKQAKLASRCPACGKVDFRSSRIPVRFNT